MTKEWLYNSIPVGNRTRSIKDIKASYHEDRHRANEINARSKVRQKRIADYIIKHELNNYDAAEFFNLTEPTIKKWVRKGKELVSA